MYCQFCNKEYEENQRFCPICGNPLTEKAYVSEGRQLIDDEKRSTLSRKNIILYVTFGIITVLSLACLVFSVTSLINSKKVLTDNSFSGLVVEDYNKTTTENTALLKGEISSESASELYINGEKIDRLDGNNLSKKWSKVVNLNMGQNRFIITLASSGEESNSKILDIFKTNAVTYPTGTIFVKSNKSAIYIRPQPQISDKYVIKLPYNDYTTQLECIGEESTDSSGYLWSRVKTPSNGLGWVRTDLVKVLQ